jgi:hypothetical protein
MAEPTLASIFGAGATQTATAITILKSDLAMTAAAVNRGEQIFAAIVKKAALTLTQTAFDADPTYSISIVPAYDSLVYRTNGTIQETLLQTPVTIGFHQIQASGGINPDNY